MFYNQNTLISIFSFYWAKLKLTQLEMFHLFTNFGGQF